jgi:hypothetical protein
VDEGKRRAIEANRMRKRNRILGKGMKKKYEGLKWKGCPKRRNER